MDKLEKGKHTLINLNNMQKPIKKIVIPIVTTTLSISLFSGCSLDKIINNGDSQNIVGIEEEVDDTNFLVTSHNWDSEVTIPEYYQSRVRSAAGLNDEEAIKIKDLLKLEELIISTDKEIDLSWLNYCNNLKRIQFMVYDDGTSLKSIKNLQNLKHLDINFINIGDAATFDNESLSFINNSTNIEEMDISFTYGFKQNEILNYIEAKDKIVELSISANDPSAYTLSFDQYPNLKKLDLGDSGAYDLAIFLTNKQINNLFSRDVEVICSAGVIEKTIEINQKLDEILKETNIRENESDIEKNNKILFYILDNLEYDENIAYFWNQNIPHDAEAKDFYRDGTLYGALETNGKAICGNYSALYQALANRVGLSSYYLISHNHAWNLVNINGEYYYMDTTWIDSDESIVITMGQNGESITTVTTAKDNILNGKEEEVEWYLLHPDIAKEYDDERLSHTPNNMPGDIVIQPYEKDINSIVESKFKIILNNREWIVLGAVVVGILAAFGIAIKKNDIKRKKEIEKYRSTFL